MTRLNGSYTTRQNVNDTFRIELEEYEEGRWLGYDWINFSSRGVHVDTPKGYEKSVEGAYAYAAAVFKTTARSH